MQSGVEMEWSMISTGKCGQEYENEGTCFHKPRTTLWTAVRDRVGIARNTNALKLEMKMLGEFNLAANRRRRAAMEKFRRSPMLRERVCGA